MNIELSAKDYTITEKLENLITKKLERLDKFFDEDCKAKVRCKKERNTYILEITIAARPNMLRAESRSTEEIYPCIDTAIAKLIRQIHRHKDRVGGRIQDYAKEQELTKFSVNDEEKIPTVVKRKTFALEPMSLEDAIARLEMIDHNFYVFLDNKTGRVNVLYTRIDGDYGVIETIV